MRARSDREWWKNIYDYTRMTIMKRNMIFSIWTNSMSVCMPSNAYGKVPQSIECFFKVPKANKNNLWRRGSNICFLTKIISNISQRWNQNEQKQFFWRSLAIKEPERNQKGAKGCQKETKDQENHQKSCFEAFEVFFFFSLIVFH